MKRLLIALALVFIASAASAQVGPVVTSARFVEWDHEPASAAITLEYRIYLSRSPDPIPDGTPDAVVLAPLQEWAIGGIQPGQWHVTVTAFTSSGDVESEHAIAIGFFVFDPPGNLRVR